MTLTNVMNWLKSQTDVGDGIAVGLVVESDDRRIGVYDGKSSGGNQRICIGGKKNTKYQEKNIVVLVHWTKNFTEAEEKAHEVYRLFYGLSGVDMDGVKIISANPGNQPKWAGRSARGICEYAILVKLTYERNDQNAK